MNHTDLIMILESHLKNEEKNLQYLRILLCSQKISQFTFAVIEKKIEHEIFLIKNLIESLVAEEDYWKNSVSRLSRILELLLVEFEEKFLLGEIGKEELKRKNDVISQGLAMLVEKNVSEDSIRVGISEVAKIEVEQATPGTFQKEIIKPEFEEIDFSSITEQEISKNIRVNRISNNRQSFNKPRRHMNEESSEFDSTIDSVIHCMNPWKPECRNTDIELSIYYKGRQIPICHKCWEDISNKNVEWSSL